MNDGNGDEFCDEHSLTLAYVQSKPKASNAAKQNFGLTYTQKVALRLNTRRQPWAMRKTPRIHPAAQGDRFLWNLELKPGWFHFIIALFLEPTVIITNDETIHPYHFNDPQWNHRLFRGQSNGI